ncbi:MAG: cytochrome P450 [Halioglobus sp.]
MTKAVADAALMAANSLPRLPDGDLSHLPGHKGLPLIGDALPFLKNTLKYMRRYHDLYGDVFWTCIGPTPSVHLVDADAVKLLTLDSDKNFSTGKGYEGTLSSFFPDGLLLKDFSDHRMHRRIMQSAFKNAMLEQYMSQIHDIVRDHMGRWQGQKITFVSSMKDCLLEVGSKVFLGMELGEDSKRINRGFVDMAHGCTTPFRLKIPGTTYYNAVKGYEFMSQRFHEQIPEKRASNSTDMFSLFCKETQEDGNYFSDEDIVHHINFLLFAAHDTTTSTLSGIMYQLMENPDWLRVCRDEALAIDKDKLCFSDLDQLTNIGYCFKEVLRLCPPVVGLGRRSIREFDFKGYKIPANTLVSASSILVQRDPKYYTNPDAFDPLRFSPGREEHKKHNFAWSPFGGGAHKCIGLHFAEMLVKVTLFELLRNCEFESTEPASEYTYLPFPKPINDLPLNVLSR